MDLFRRDQPAGQAPAVQLVGRSRQTRPAFTKALALAAGILAAQVLPVHALDFGPVDSAASPAATARQIWRVPSALPDFAARAIVYRPSGTGPFRLAVIAHASTENAVARAQMPAPDYPALAAALTARGFVVVIPERPGHGATGGPYREAQGNCTNADHLRSGEATADDIAAALSFMRKQDFVRGDQTVIVGHSAGGFGALAFAARNPTGVSTILAFAPGRGGHADNVPNAICARDRLIAATVSFGRKARIPVTWLVAANDSYFAPDISSAMADAFRKAGGTVSLRIMPAFESEGHWFVERATASELDDILSSSGVSTGRR